MTHADAMQMQCLPNHKLTNDVLLSCATWQIYMEVATCRLNKIEKNHKPGKMLFKV